MEIRIFGREACPNCKAAKRSIDEFVETNEIPEAVYYDMDTVDGRAEGAFYDVRSIPTTIVTDNGEDLARWDGVVPPKEELSVRISKGRCYH